MESAKSAQSTTVSKQNNVLDYITTNGKSTALKTVSLKIPVL